MTSSSAIHDLLVVGAGPCGLAAAISAMREGLDVVVLDQGPVVSAILAYPTYATFFSTAEKLSLGDIPFVVAHGKPDRRDALAYYRAIVKHFGIRVRQYERVTAIEGSKGDFTVRSQAAAGERLTRARAVVVATGYWGSPNVIGVPGEDLPHVTHAYVEGHEAFQLDVLVVGGGNSAAEAALDLYRADARVTLAHFGPTWDKRIKPWILTDVENRMAEGAITARWNSRLVEILPDEVVLDTPAGRERRRAERVYLMTGFVPNDELLVRTGIPIDPVTGIPAHDPASLETSVPGVYIVGVLVAGFDANKVFIENGRYHGDRVVAHLLGRPSPVHPVMSADADS